MRHEDMTWRGWRVATVLGGFTLLLALAGTATAQTITPIATIQANPSAFDAQVVTVEGQVYVPSNYRAPTYSGYIQDSSGRGINIFGSAANNPALFNIGNIVRVTGTVDIFFTTVEITSLSNVIEVSRGNPPLQPQKLSTAAAASTSWEGTFIEVTGTISVATPSGPGTNYTVNDGSGPIDVRVVDNLGVTFTAGQTITARGAGGQFGTTYQVLVGRAADVFVGSGGDTTPPTLTGATAPTATQVVVSFNERVASATAETASNYAVFETATPANVVVVTGAALAVDARSVTLTLGGTLQAGVGYTIRVNGVQDEAGNTIAANSTQTFTYSTVQVTPIATIQANPSAFDAQVVTVEGQVFVPANYRAPTYSGYIQDGSGRGINIFGTAANNALLNDLGNIVRVTGTVDIFFTTVEITNLTDVALVSGGNPPLQPQHLGTGAAASSSWEGTFIEIAGTIAVATPSGPGTNYTTNDGSGPIDVRVVDNLGVTFSAGQTITARGAGGQFGTTYQVLVGRAADVFTGTGEDTTPPTLTAAAASSATQVLVSFSERVSAATAQATANYAVFETATPANTVPVTGATLAGSAQSVTLALGASLQTGVGYTVRVNGVQDEAGNTIAANSTRTFTFSSVQVTPIATIQANPSAFVDQVVTVEGQVFVPANYRAPTYSGYIQDSSNRGINVFGSAANNALLNDVGNVVRVTGTVALFFTTVEITNLTSVTLVSGGNPQLQPQQLGTGAAASSAWEGTFIEATGTISLATPSGPGTNYTINDGSGAVDARVVDALGAGPFTAGQTITARGAGGQFSSTFQILVGRAADVFVASGPSGAVSLSLSGPPYTFVPTVGETYPVAVSVPPERLAKSEVLLRIFDLQGRLRRTLADSRFGPVLPKVAWNGRDDAAELVPAGTYIVHLLVTDTKSGGRETKQMPVVVATRLNR